MLIVSREKISKMELNQQQQMFADDASDNSSFEKHNFPKCSHF